MSSWTLEEVLGNILFEAPFYISGNVYIYMALISDKVLSNEELQRGLKRRLESSCCCIEPGFGSQHLHWSSQPPITPGPGDPNPLLDSTGTVTQGAHTYIQEKDSVHKKIESEPPLRRLNLGWWLRE